ncbi:MAG: DUF4038 domain-containing protein [Firmicutes bacterium]|nr:DUF4038 domain-containing protein [Bacillota bacterium]
MKLVSWDGFILEGLLETQQYYEDPVAQIRVWVELTAPSEQRTRYSAFWDGNGTWRVRAAVTEPGLWKYSISASDKSNTDFDGKSGSFEIEKSPQIIPLLQRGRLRVGKNGSYLEHTDGTPFFYLADTAWNGILKSKPEDWDHYLSVRKEQGFTAVQCVLTHWRSFAADAHGEVAYTGTDPIAINPRFFQRLDDKVAAVNRHGLVAALVLLWACTEKDPGHYLPEREAIKLARYLVARYGAYQVIWMLGGDGDYRGEKAERWQRIGRAVFDGNDTGLVTMHPGGQHWVADEFRHESWFDFISYQSGHGDNHEHLRWLVEKYPAQQWQKQPLRPIINQEPNYEAHMSYHSREIFDAHKVRRALYWSLLVSPTAGVTYGHHGVWPWTEEAGVPLDHPGTGESPMWHESLDSEGAMSVTHLHNFFSQLRWWSLRPAPELLKEQPGRQDPSRFIAVSRAEDKSFAVAYLPAGGTVSFESPDWQPSSCRWYDPRTGQWLDRMDFSASLVAPDDQDWVLWMG